MIVLVVLFGSWLILRSIGALGVTALATWRDSVRYALVVMFVFTGVAHFNKMRRDLAQMIPSYFPQPMFIVYVTGVGEFLGAAGLLIFGSYVFEKFSETQPLVLVLGIAPFFVPIPRH